MLRVQKWVCIILLLTSWQISANPTDVVLGEEYEGEYQVQQAGMTFDYLQGRSGRLIAIFYGSPNREVLNSLDLFILDPLYEDSRMVLLQLKGVIALKDADTEWQNASHTATYTTIWREREQDSFELASCTSLIKFQNLGTDDYEKVTMHIEIAGKNFALTADLTYYDQVDSSIYQMVSTMAYSVFVTAVLGIQIYCAWVLLRVMDAPNFVFTGKLSLLTLSLCNIEDFSQTMTHIQYIMGSESGYLFFILPALAYILLFIIFDMKMLFLVWRSHNLRNMENPQLLRKRLTAFYIQFYLGLFLYLTLAYFFTNDQWFIIVRNLLLLPQIIHNIRLGSNPGFHPHYILGFIGSRLLLPIYERACPANRFRLTPDTALVLTLVALYLLQLLMLSLQYRLGSRFFVPKRFLPNYYNYKQKVRQSQRNKEADCSICLQSIFQAESTEQLSLNASEVGEQLMEQVTVMVTPCNHLFHNDCLTHWMEVKLECPTCRAVLPPL